MEKDLLDVYKTPSQGYEVHTFADNDFEEETVAESRAQHSRPSYVVYQVC